MVNQPHIGWWWKTHLLFLLCTELTRTSCIWQQELYGKVNHQPSMAWLVSPRSIVEWTYQLPASSFNSFMKLVVLCFVCFCKIEVVHHKTLEQETQLSLTNRATHLCKCSGVVDPIKHAPSHVCYHAEFGRSALKGCRHKYWRTPKFGDRWNSDLLGWETWLTPK